MRSKALPLTAAAMLILLAGCQSRPLAEECYQAPSSGQGTESLERWYFHESWNECRPFIWGGGDDGTVPFDSEEACREACLQEQ